MNNYNLKGRRAIVTGGAQGFGFAITKRFLESGVVAVNTGVVALAEAPFGGIKQTGYGREGGSNAIKDYLNVKYTHMGLEI